MLYKCDPYLVRLGKGGELCTRLHHISVHVKYFTEQGRSRSSIKSFRVCVGSYSQQQSRGCESTRDRVTDWLYLFLVPLASFNLLQYYDRLDPTVSM